MVKDFEVIHTKHLRGHRKHIKSSKIKWLKWKNIYVRRRSNQLTQSFFQREIRKFQMQNELLESFTWCVSSLSALVQVRCLVGKWICCRRWWHCEHGHVWGGLTSVGLWCHWVITLVELLLERLNKKLVSKELKANRRKKGQKINEK